MANLIKKESNVGLELDPYRAMREMLRWDPFREMAPILSYERNVWAPKFDVTENRALIEWIVGHERIGGEREHERRRSVVEMQHVVW